MSRSDDEVLRQNSLPGELSALQQAVVELRQPPAPSVVGQLRAARRVALTQDAKPGLVQRLVQSLGLAGLFVPGAVLASALSAVLVAFLLLSGTQTSVNESLPQVQASSNSLLEDLSIMAAQDELQFYQDLELMQWLAQEDGLDVQG